jgi:hypothetical protein
MGSQATASITQFSKDGPLPFRKERERGTSGTVADPNCRFEAGATVHPLLEGVGALTIPCDGPVGIPLALAATFAFRAGELPGSAYHGPLVASGLKLSALQHALARAGVGVVNLVTIFCCGHEHPMPRGRVSHGFVELRAYTFFLLHAADFALDGGASCFGDGIAMIRLVTHVNTVCIRRLATIPLRYQLVLRQQKR